jgi:hypothetical protein
MFDCYRIASHHNKLLVIIHSFILLLLLHSSIDLLLLLCFNEVDSISLPSEKEAANTS